MYSYLASVLLLEPQWLESVDAEGITFYRNIQERRPRGDRMGYAFEFEIVVSSVILAL